MKSFNTPGFRAGDWLIISGQTGRVGNELVSNDFDKQFLQCMENLKNILKQHNADLTHIAKVNIYVRNISDREPMNDLYTNFFQGHLPARTTVGVSELSRNALVEVEAWAFLGQSAN